VVRLSALRLPSFKGGMWKGFLTVAWIKLGCDSRIARTKPHWSHPASSARGDPPFDFYDGSVDRYAVREIGRDANPESAFKEETMDIGFGFGSSKLDSERRERRDSLTTASVARCRGATADRTRERDRRRARARWRW
jgi:hypothetical protein